MTFVEPAGKDELNMRNLEVIEMAARVAHEVNRVYCGHLGDASQLSWSASPDWQKKSCISGVAERMKNPHQAPETSHERWLEHKEKEGWKYGPIKDAEKKEHPCMVPYDQLPSDQKLKDHFFCAVVDAFVDYLKD
jgi:hypothetical protein